MGCHPDAPLLDGRRPVQTVRRVSVRHRPTCLDWPLSAGRAVRGTAAWACCRLRGGVRNTMTSVRRSDFDVTNSVQVRSPRAVLRAVEVLYRPTWPGLSMEPLARAFEHFERLFAGRVPGYHGVDTVYHDRLHTLALPLA